MSLQGMKKLENGIARFYETMLLIREFENRLLELFSQGKLFGTAHTYIGQEANAVGVISNLHPDDIIVSNHRCHGHFLAFKKDPYSLLCELMGKSDGLCNGRGGSQHLCDGNFFTNGVQGGIFPLACGLAFAERYKGSNRVVTVFIGDGTLGQGIIYEGFNIAAKWKLPLLIVIENNKYAQSTKIENNLAGKIADRLKAFAIENIELSTFDVRVIRKTAEGCIHNIRKAKRPMGLILNTYRYAPHSTTDDGRDPAEIVNWKKKDCIKLLEKEMEESEVEKIKEAVNIVLCEVEERALAAPYAGDVKRE